ncbi:MAG: ATP-binding protein [Bifidobacteriaceae bacterium]|nr:ATP-binding protein [Bifidobacteriaceae bacterium]
MEPNTTPANTPEFHRTLDDALTNWSANPSRKPLVLLGAWQTGKTHALKKLAAVRYANLAFIDFSQTPQAASAFDDSISPADIVRKLELLLGISIAPERTLIVFDEVQLCERALTSLKYFCDEAPEYHVAVAGSLLGVAVNRSKYSFPVGKVTLLPVHPLTFHEFLDALGFSGAISDIRHGLITGSPIAFHAPLIALSRLYMTVGGMPEAVQAFVAARDNGPYSLAGTPSPHALSAARTVQSAINTAYEADMIKYVQTEDSAKIFEAWHSIPAQLAKENHKFQYKAIRSGARAAQYAPAIDWLASAGIVNLCTQVTEPVSPLAAFENPTAFKVYLEDTGLLMARYNATLSQLNPADAKSANFRGAIAENFVMQTLVTSGLKPYYWGTPSKGELEFLLDVETPQRNTMQPTSGGHGMPGESEAPAPHASTMAGEPHRWALPLEVKSGRNVSARSLTSFQAKYSPDYMVRVSTKNFGFDNAIRSVPLYAVQALAEEISAR